MVSYSLARAELCGLAGAFGVWTVTWSLLGSPGGMPGAGPWDAMPTSEGAGVLAQTASSTSVSVRASRPASRLLARVDRVHRRGQAVFGHAADRVDGPGDDLRQLRALDRVEVGEHPVGPPAAKAGGRFPDADAHPHEVGSSQALDDAAHPVIAGVPASDLQAHVAPGQVELVVDDDHVGGRHLEERGGGLHA